MFNDVHVNGKGQAIGPAVLEVILLSFEGPDRYAMAGGLGVRVTELARTFAAVGYRVRLIFVGDPQLPYETTEYDGRLTFQRWAQWVSHYYPRGVYDGEEAKLSEWTSSLPGHVVGICRDIINEGRIPVVLAEDWHTADALMAISDRLHHEGLRQQTVLLWNANNTAGFHRVHFPRLSFCATLLTVSRFMKHEMWKYGVNPIVVPNGIPSRLVEMAPPTAEGEQLRHAMGSDPILFKIGRFSPDKRWMMAIDAVAGLHAMGHNARLVMRGGIEPHGGEVIGRARQLGLHVHDIHLPEDDRGLTALLDAMRDQPHAHVYNLAYFVPEEVTRAFYYGADAVLANSGFEPFGLVGLEVMAAGGVAVTGATGEDYARNGMNALVVETEDPMELTALIRNVLEDAALSRTLREQGQSTAATYTWETVIEDFIHRVAYVAFTQRLTVNWPIEEPIDHSSSIPAEVHASDDDRSLYETTSSILVEKSGTHNENASREVGASHG